MSKKPRGKPVLMAEGHPLRRPGQKPYKRVTQDEFRNCAAPEGCPNIVSIHGKPAGYSEPIYCVLHRIAA